MPRMRFRYGTMTMGSTPSWQSSRSRALAQKASLSALVSVVHAAPSFWNSNVFIQPERAGRRRIRESVTGNSEDLPELIARRLWVGEREGVKPYSQQRSRTA